jgi:hypothetical protein
LTTLARALRGIALLGAMGVLCVRSAAADTPALSFTDFSGTGSGQYSIGWEFDVLSPVTVSGLGMFDYLDNLNPGGHDVGIFDSAGNLVAGATATVLPTDPKTGWFRFAALTTPVNLPVGSNYRIAGVTLDQYYSYSWPNPPVGWAVDPSIRYVRNRYLDGDLLVYPTQTDNDGPYGFFGPNMMLRNGDPVPEPALIQLPALLGLGGLAWWRRRRA